ncbi:MULTISPECIES: MerR family transcriptional regulator [unclassified Hyphomicrobium]|uniref:MerR family transcriptional regulator n=1 Tax=unclassified Hyphomicrobium TaxID=2619925 RepID=UPI000213E1D1|nr:MULTISPECIES: MerR family transcriptional regulator [unclassified Hyphomicrobium]CCB65872.1 putative transcriptional regulator, MerR family [Hyphomicrobium sp. MC1]
MNKSAEAFRTIGEVADELQIPKHVLRFWEGRFPQIRPMKRGGGRRYYRPEDMELLRGIRALLHAEGYTIRGVQKILREHGVDQVKAAAHRVAAPQPAPTTAATGRKRGRKPIAKPAPSVVAIEPPAKAPVDFAAITKSQIQSAIRELEIACAILRGQPINPVAAPDDVKKSRAGRT